MINNNVSVTKVGKTILVSTEEDWKNCIHNLIDSKKQFGITNNPILNDIEQDFVCLIKDIIENGIYYTFDLDSLYITKRYTLNTQISTTSNETNPELISTNNFRSLGLNEVQHRLNKYFTSLVDPQIGVFNGHYRGIADSMPLIAFDGKLGSRDYDAYGRANTYRDSYYTGILEALERYHGLGSLTVKSVIKTENELDMAGESFVPFKKFYHYDTFNFEQTHFDFPIYSSCKHLSWVKTYSIFENKSVLIPEQIAYFSFEQLENAKNEPRYISETSNGTALGSNWYEASIAAILELIERDSFLVHWYTKSKPKILNDNMNIDDQEIQMILGYLEYVDYKTHIFDITLETGIPTYWILLEYKGEDDTALSFYTAAGSNFNELKAIKSALIEASTSIKVFKEYMSAKYTDEELGLLRQDFFQVKQLEDHLYLFSDNSMRQYLDFALIKPEEISFNDSIARHKNIFCFSGSNQKELFEALIGRINIVTKNIYITDLSTIFLNKMGFSCVKAHIPDFQNIGFGMQYQNINKDRLQQALAQNNLDGNLKEIFDCPHPFP
ncbi:hypothetical protein HCA99_16500 [Listeria booriae]|uniref:YcaO-like family protein n=1 Tax=Listeria booriae TaxID=1552123 RepID=UPI001625C8F4|nr:YcaO-like family protein [Listeria booriae]MBC2080833.1 hypothetical protein [Listeria booriae]